MIQDLYKQKRSLELKWEQEHLSKVDILLKWSELMTKLKKSSLKIKLEEAAIAHRQNTVEGAAPQVSVAT